MRVIAGQWRGRRFQAPPGETTRPIMDRAKTVIFDVLGSRAGQPGQVAAVPVLDLFAGSGALGIEALSRGASWCCFVDSKAGVVAVIERNLESFGAASAARVVRADACRCGWPPPPDSDRYGLVFVDAPYWMWDDRRAADRLAVLFDHLAGDANVADEAVIVVRCPSTAAGVGATCRRLTVTDRRPIGSMVVEFLTRAPAARTSER